MRKAESLNKLERAGLNTPKWCTAGLGLVSWPNADITMELRRRLGEPPWSIRTEKGEGEGAFPFHYNIDGDEAAHLIKQLLGEGYEVMVSKTIDIRGCLACGCLVLFPTVDNPPFTEYITGPHTVRGISTGKVTPTKLELMQPNTTVIEQDILNTIFVRGMSYPLPGLSMVLEWSLYREGVGKKNNRDIWWEVRTYGEHQRHRESRSS